MVWFQTLSNCCVEDLHGSGSSPPTVVAAYPPIGHSLYLSSACKTHPNVPKLQIFYFYFILKCPQNRSQYDKVDKTSNNSIQFQMHTYVYEKAASQKLPFQAHPSNLTTKTRMLNTDFHYMIFLFYHCLKSASNIIVYGPQSQFHSQSPSWIYEIYCLISDTFSTTLSLHSFYVFNAQHSLPQYIVLIHHNSCFHCFCSLFH